MVVPLRNRHDDFMDVIRRKPLPNFVRQRQCPGFRGLRCCQDIVPIQSYANCVIDIVVSRNQVSHNGTGGQITKVFVIRHDGKDTGIDNGRRFCDGVVPVYIVALRKPQIVPRFDPASPGDGIFRDRKGERSRSRFRIRFPARFVYVDLDRISDRPAIRVAAGRGDSYRDSFPGDNRGCVIRDSSRVNRIRALINVPVITRIAIGRICSTSAARYIPIRGGAFGVGELRLCLLYPSITSYSNIII